MRQKAPTHIKINSPLELAYSKGNIVFTYKYNHKTFRYNAFKVSEDCFNKKTKSLKIMPDLYDCTFAVDRIEKLAKNVNEAIIEISKYKSPNDSITKAKVDEYIADNLTKKEIASSQYGLIADFEKWITVYKEKKYKEEIKKGRKGRKNHPSAKDYISTKNLLLDYEWDSDDYDNYDEAEDGKYIKRLTYADVDDDFLTDLIEYCYEPRINTKFHKYYTQGDMVNKTIQKRLDCLFTFLSSQYREIPNDIKKPQLETLAKRIIRLDRKELRLLEALDIKEERFNLFFCFASRPSEAFNLMRKAWNR